MSTFKTRSRTVFALAAALAGLSTAAAAAEPSFRFHAGDLSAPAALYERMADAAAAACQSPGRKGLWSIRAEKACADRLLDDFVAGAASPSLTAVHEQSSRDRLAGLR